MPERKIKISWVQLREHLQQVEIISKDEEIREITLVKPREILLYLQLRK